MKFNISFLDILDSPTKIKIIKFLLSHEAPMSEREIASVLKVSHMSINRTMRELVETNLVNFVTSGKAHLWRVNRKSYAFKALSEFVKGVLSLKEPLADLKGSLLKKIPRKLILKAVLFGSVAKGFEKTNSDIDLFILVKDKKNKKSLDSSLEKLSNFCLETYGNKLSPYILTEPELKRKKGLKIISEINKGVQIFPSVKDKK
jgi:predicted nucleotidyltransferase